MNIDRKNKKMTILLFILCFLFAVKIVVFFSWEYQSISLKYIPTALPSKKKEIKLNTPSEQKPEEYIKDGLLIGQYVRETSLPLNPTVRIGYLVPVDSNQEPRPGAENMVFYGVFNGEGKRIPCSQAWLQQLAKKYSCTVFSLSINSNLSITEDRDKYYIYREAGWFDVVFSVQKNLAKRFKFPSQKLLLVGESSGGSMVQRIVAAYPDRIAAAAWCGGSRYDMEQMKKDGIPRLILNTWGCPGEATSVILAKQERKLGNPVLVAQMPPDPTLNKWYHHAPGPESYRLIQEYIGGMAEMLHRNKGQIPKLKTEKDFFPSALFAASWQNRFQLKSLYGLNEVSLIQTRNAKTKKIAIIFGRTTGEFRIQMLDALYWLSQRETLSIQIKIGDKLLDEYRNASKLLTRILREKKWENLPILIIGIGDASLPGVIAALTNGNSRIRKIVFYGTSYDLPFPELSIIKNRKKSQIPLLICSETKNGLSLPYTKFRKFSIMELSNSSWKSEIEEHIDSLTEIEDVNKEGM